MHKSKTKQILALILTLTLILTAIPLTALPAAAATDGDYEYQVLSEADKTCKITKYTGSATELTIPSQLDGYSITSIGSNAFYSCTSLVNITIPNSIKSIDGSAFRDCISLVNITIPSGVTYIDNNAFEGCTSLTAINVSENNTEYCSVDGVLFNKEKTELICYPAGKTAETYTIPSGVTSIGDRAFDGCTSLTSVTIPSGVTSIGAYAFYNCTSLTSIIIPDSVTSIDYGAFNNTAYYNNEANWENGVLYMGNHLIEAKRDISGEYQIKQGTKTIVGYAFRSCTSLTSVVIPDSVTSIGYAAFQFCTSLTSVSIGSGVVSIGNEAFSLCSSLTSIVIPNSVKNIGDSAFWRCTALENITIPDSVTEIGSGAFLETAYYNNEANWENGVLYIGNHLIKAKEDISGSYEIKEGTKTIAGYAFRDCTALTGVTIPNSVINIGHTAFAYCENLTSITIPSSVASISEHTFWNCTSLESVNIPDSITSIGSNAFYSCTSLMVIAVPDSVTSIGEKALGFFYNSETDKTEKVPDFVIFGNKGSQAEKYAAENGLIFELQFGDVILPGDVNGDGKVSAVDARWALQCAAKKRVLTAEQIIAADMNEDGKITAVDARQILKKAAGKA